MLSISCPTFSFHPKKIQFNGSYHAQIVNVQIANKMVFMGYTQKELLHNDDVDILLDGNKNKI